MASTVEERLKEVAAVGQEIAETGVAYLDGKFVPLADAKVSIATHALQYGTGVFEGIRAYWNPTQGQLFAFRLREHFERMARSVRIVRIALPGDAETLSGLAVELLRKNAYQNDVYIRPLAFKAARSVKVALEGLRDGFGMYAFPLGAYLPTGGLVARTVSWRRTSDDAIPARGKLTGAYINTALAVDEAHDYEADEAIFLTADGHVSEGGGANLFMVREGTLVTPPVTADILEGITRDSILRLVRELGITVEERPIDRTELYVAEEVFFCGTGAQVAPCVKVDGRTIGDGAIGPVAKRIGDLYFAIARGDDKRHAEWRTAVYS
ncbi:MAG TPA: branched-chain amino acid transaminase [Candidatus Limnocylindria bacterium]|jgi:branched-chain amino acid aminotransferase|nr:branched-chain amino acid transaminase [Candidatus Limnocylindria bacterium]